MRRYRVLSFDFDTRATILQEEINPHWEDKVREQWEENKASVKASLIKEFGEHAKDVKLRNFADLGPRGLSVIAFHNKFAIQIRSAFVVGGYYPALTGACGLDERILNHLLLRLRDYYRDRPEYKQVYRKDSFDDWLIPINALESWGILQPEAINAFKALHKIRNQAIHFHPETDQNERTLALQAISLIDRITLSQFPVMGLQPWFIPGSRGESFISRDWEEHPFVKEVYLPNCLYVGPDHFIESMIPKLIVRDRDVYPDRELSDEEYLELRSKADSSWAIPAPEA